MSTGRRADPMEAAQDPGSDTLTPGAGDRLSVLHVTAPAPAGGLERVVEGLARGHASRGHRVRVLSIIEPREDEHPFVAALSDSRAEIVPVEVSARAYLREALTVAGHCRELRPDVVHTHGFRPDVVDALAARLLGFPVVTTVHGSSRMGGVTVFYEWLQDHVFRWFDGVVAVSEALVEELRGQGVADDRIALIPNVWTGGDELLDRTAARHGLGCDPEGVVIGWVGRMIEAKGPDVFVEALARLDSPDVTVSVIGDGPQLRDVQRQVEELGMKERIRFHGLVERAARYFRAFDLFVLSSRTEGTPIVLMEAVAAGVPVVATRVGGVPEVVGADGAYLVPPEDPEALAGAIREALSDPEERRRKAGAAAARLDTHYDTGTWLRRHEAFYREVVARSAGKRT